MPKFTVREKFATIRETEVEAESIEDALRMAGTIDFPEEIPTYVETEHDAFDSDGTQVLYFGVQKVRLVG